MGDWQQDRLGPYQCFNRTKPSTRTAIVFPVANPPSRCHQVALNARVLELTAEAAAAAESSSLLRESLEKEKEDGAQRVRELAERVEAAEEATLAAAREEGERQEAAASEAAAAAAVAVAAAEEAAESLRQEKVESSDMKRRSLDCKCILRQRG